ncbi:fimbrillin family protein [Bacteroides stercorirosoris]|uniref:Fimbrillin-like n=1 Tax=Bacteroides stercorirosoris TaxID=871324 RepID=A0A1M6DSC5_9BACE|nr:fimbrillin family protein [Bacteroides stercorirosoris]SHI76122.1 Fimbrillin-like [Bacteroides stercorirosoris]
MKTSTYTRFRRLAHSAAHSAALVLAAALLATACTDPADLADGSPASTDALSFGASLLAPGNSGKHTADTRATAPVTKDAFTTDDRIAVSIDNQVKPYVYGTDLRFTATDPDNSFYWTPGQQRQDGVIAWYPYSDALPSTSSPLNISRQDTDAAFAAADFLFAGPATLTRNPSSALTFSHRTALLRLNIKADGKTVVPSQGFDVTGVDVKGTPVDATIDPTDGTLTGIGNTAVIYTHRCAATPDGYTATYEAQIIPHTISSGTSLIIHTTNPDKTYNGIILSGSYEAGHIHTYNITLGNDRVSITPTDKDLSWNDGDIRPGLPPTGYDLTVSTAKELKAFADAVNNGSTIGTSSIEARSARVLQTADIDLTGIDDWTPIGNVTSSYNYFQGSYNGNGYTISNLKIKSGESYMGLFGLVIGESSSTPAVLTGIHLRNVDIDVSHNSNISCGAIAGTVSDAVITFCSAQGEIKTDMNLQGQAYNDSGGIIADNSGGTISYCRADVKVTAFSDSNTTSVECNAGGIAGINTGTILACEASGSKVSAKASSAKTQAGGIAGKTSGGNYIASCASEVGKIIANSGGHEAYAGGVVGLQSGVLYSSYARGDATAVGASTINMAGAIVGDNSSNDTDLCIGTGAGAGTGGQGTSDLPPSSDSILYDADATDEEIYNLMQSKDFEKQDIPTTTYDATCFPAYGIEVTKVTFSSKGAWSYDPASGKIRIRGLPSVPLP